jgi:hypothetical protein
MTSEAFFKSWWGWLVCFTIVVAVGFARHWDTWSIIASSVLVVTGTLRLFSRQTKRFSLRLMASSLAKMTPEQRERELQRLSPEERVQMLREINDHAA